MKVCTRCKKHSNDFPLNASRPDGLSNMCRQCSADYHREYYRWKVATDQEFHIRKKNARKLANEKLRQSRRQQYWDFLSTQSCMDCGETDPIVLEFDHQRDKEFSVSQKVVSMTWAKLLLEINKCEIVCANCHRKRTSKQFSWYKDIQK